MQIEYEKYMQIAADRMETGRTTGQVRIFLQYKGLSEADIFFIIVGAEILFSYR